MIAAYYSMAGDQKIVEIYCFEDADSVEHKLSLALTVVLVDFYSLELPCNLDNQVGVVVSEHLDT